MSRMIPEKDGFQFSRQKKLKCKIMDKDKNVIMIPDKYGLQTTENWRVGWWKKIKNVTDDGWQRCFSIV